MYFGMELPPVGLPHQPGLEGQVDLTLQEPDIHYQLV